MTGICEIAPIGEDLSCASIPQSIAGVGEVLPDGFSPRRDSGLEFPVAGGAQEKLHWESFKTEPPSFADVVRSLGEGFVKSSEAIAKPYVEVGKFEDGIVRPNEGVVKASEGFVKPGEAPVKEREEIGKPNQDPVKPSQGLAKSSEAVAKPYVEVGKFEDGIVRPNEGVVKASEGFVKPGEAPVKEREEIGKAGEAIDGSSEEIGVRVFSIDGAQQLPAAGFQLSALENQAARPDRQVLDFYFISAANAVAESIAVSSASGSSNESALRIQLKADVLDGSSIKIETNNSELKITVIPASRAAEEMLLRNCEFFQAQLAERVANWRINVGVAALERRANHKSEEET